MNKVEPLTSKQEKLRKQQAALKAKNRPATTSKTEPGDSVPLALSFDRIKEGWVVRKWRIKDGQAIKTWESEPDVRQYAFDRYRQITVQEFLKDE